MGTDAVVDMLPLFQMSSLFFDLQWSLVDLIVIFSVGSVGSLYISVELGTSRGKVVVRHPPRLSDRKLLSDSHFPLKYASIESAT